jgi:hypothetical protein
VVPHVWDGVPLVGGDGGQLALEVCELIRDARPLSLGLLLRLDQLLLPAVVWLLVVVDGVIIGRRNIQYVVCVLVSTICDLREVRGIRVVRVLKWQARLAVSAIALQSLCNRFAITLQSLRYRPTITLQSLCDRFAFALRLLCYLLVIASQSL